VILTEHKLKTVDRELLIKGTTALDIISEI